MTAFLEKDNSLREPDRGRCVFVEFSDAVPAVRFFVHLKIAASVIARSRPAKNNRGVDESRRG